MYDPHSRDKLGGRSKAAPAAHTSATTQRKVILVSDRFARWLALTMSNESITGRELAQKLGVDDSVVSRWRTGRGTPSMDSCLKLAKVLNVDPLRLAVTAGALDGKAVGLEPLDMPSARAQRERIAHQLRNIRGLSTQTVEQMLKAFDAAESDNHHA